MRRLGKERRFFRGQMAFTLIEVLLGVAIIGAIGIGAIRAIDTTARARQVLDEKIQATNLVTAYLEGIRQLPYSDDASPYASVDASIVKPPQYSVAVNIYYSADGINWVTTRTTETLQKITISVSREGGKPVLSTCTFKAPRTK